MFITINTNSANPRKFMWHCNFNLASKSRQGLPVAIGFAIQVCLETNHSTSVAVLPGLVGPMTSVYPARLTQVIGKESLWTGLT